jgi:hypothetical protein
MRKKRLLTFAVMLLAGLQLCFAQKFEPTRTWPYLYRDFQNGLIITNTEDEQISAAVNITLGGRVHYINEKDQKVMEADILRVASVRIADDVYANVGGRMMRLIAVGDDGIVACETALNADELNKSDIGYGISSATASTMNVNSLASAGSTFVDMPLNSIMAERDAGEKLPVKQTNYFRVGINVIPATKAAVMNCGLVDKDAAKAFFKSNKIKWNDPKSLRDVVNFLSEQINK